MIRSPAISAFFALVILAAGCATTPPAPASRPSADARPIPLAASETSTDKLPAMVMDNPTTLQARQSADAAVPLDADLPWWIERNEARLSITNGIRSPQFTDYLIWTEDRQQQFGDRTWDINRRVTYTRSYGQLIR